MTKDFAKPIIVLTAICLIVSALLALTYGVTSPLIEQANINAANTARSLVVPGGTSFSSIDYVADNLIDCYKDDSGKGYAITTQANGYGGVMKVMVGFDNEGNITGVQVLSHSESQGIGTKAVGNQSYLDQYIGQNSDLSVDGVSGATYSSKGLKSAISYAFEIYNKVKEL